jgi:hypothetical protein
MEADIDAGCWLRTLVLELVAGARTAASTSMQYEYQRAATTSQRLS